MAQSAAARAGATEQLIDVLALTLARQLHKPQFRELSNLGARRIITDGGGEMLQKLKLVPPGIHVDEVDDDHTTDVAQLQLTADLSSRLTVGPKNRFARIGGPGERSRIDVDHRERLGGLDDHVTA